MPSVAVANYLRVLPEHFDRAVEGGAPAAQNAAQCGAELGRKRRERRQRTPVFPEKQERVRNCTNVQTDGEGFEPPVREPAQQFSRLPP